MKREELKYLPAAAVKGNDFPLSIAPACRLRWSPEHYAAAGGDGHYKGICIANLETNR